MADYLDSILTNLMSLDDDKWLSSSEMYDQYKISRHTLKTLVDKGFLEIEQSVLPGTGCIKRNRYKKSSTFGTSVGLRLPETVDSAAILANENNVIEDITDLVDQVTSEGTVEAYLKQIDKLSEAVYVQGPSNLDYTKEGARTKILSLSDLHIPFHHKVLVDKILDEHSDADILVLNGDIIDAYAASSFGKSKNIPMHTEYTLALDFVRKCSKMFTKVFLVRGNHEHRLEKYFANNTSENMNLWGTKDCLSTLAKGFVLDAEGNVKGRVAMDNVYYNVNGNPWLLKLNKTVFVHPNSFKGGPLRTVMSACDFLQNTLAWDSYDSVIMGHSHQLGKIMYKGKMLIEQGCLVNVMDYNKNAKLPATPSSLGYAVIIHDENGDTLFNESNPVYCGTLNYLT